MFFEIEFHEYLDGVMWEMEAEKSSKVFLAVRTADVLPETQGNRHPGPADPTMKQVDAYLGASANMSADKQESEQKQRKKTTWTQYVGL